MLACRALHAATLACVAALLKRREQRCHAWLAASVAAFKDSSEASELQTALAAHLQRLEAAWQLCSASCASCLLPCRAVGTHSAHTCGTDHCCKAACAFCQHENPDTAVANLAVCREKAGHGGKHVCAVQTHTCGKPCKLQNALNCRTMCGKEPGHDGDCDCLSGNHLCGQSCDLAGCAGRCTVPYGTEHDKHACEDKSCPEVCHHPSLQQTQSSASWTAYRIWCSGASMFHIYCVHQQSLMCNALACCHAEVPAVRPQVPRWPLPRARGAGRAAPVRPRARVRRPPPPTRPAPAPAPASATSRRASRRSARRARRCACTRASATSSNTR